jgi:glutamine cyclotransferase
MKITLFGLDRTLAELNAFSYSGSGWGYGSSMSVMCKALEMDEILTQW